MMVRIVDLGFFLPCFYSFNGAKILKIWQLVDFICFFVNKKQGTIGIEGR
jgi:hypothetical protein